MFVGYHAGIEELAFVEFGLEGLFGLLGGIEVLLELADLVFEREVLEL